MREFFPMLPARRWAILFIAVLAAGLASFRADAQVLYGSLVGNVTDQNGAVVAGATVTATNKETGLVREATTNEDGEYALINLLPGVYDVKVTRQGFSSYTETGLNITANNAARVDVSMKIGNVNDVVSVAADATVLQTESATVKSEISAKEIQSLPISAYRNYQALINLVPGAIPAGVQNANTDTPERSLTTNVNGTARNNNNTRLDGASSVNVWLPHHAGYVAPSESVQEVNISTNNFDAEQGLAGGAAIQVITKSGTNEFHGAAFAYHDNHVFRARNIFQPLQLGKNKPKNLRTIPGGTLGGPIIKDKLFFFGSFEGMYERVIRDGFFTVPQADIRTGNFAAYNTNIYDPFTGNIDGFERTTFTGNVIPTNRISPVALEILKRVPLPNLFGADGRALSANNFYNSAPQIFDRNNFDGKVNWNRNENHQIWTKFSHMNAKVTGSYALGEAGGPCLCDGGSGTGDTKSYIGTIGHTWTLGSGFVMDGNFSIAQREQVVLPPDYGQNIGLDVLKIPGTNGPDIRQSGLPQFNFGTGYTNYGNQNNWAPLERSERSYTFAHNASKIMGKHDFRFGADIVRHELNHWQPEIGVGPRGAFTFNGEITGLRGGASPNQYNSFAAFLLGTPQRAEKSLQYEVMTTREWQLGFYVRDRWQATRNLTLTLGLRYELYPLMNRADRGIERIDFGDPINFNQAVVRNAAGQPTGELRVLIGGRGNNPNDLDVETSKKLFAPRVGFAYRIGDDTVVRGGYGITYDPMPFGRPLRGFYPLTIAQSFIATAPGASEVFTPWGFNTAGNRALGLTVGIPNFTGPDLSTGVVNLPGTVQMRTPYQGTLHRGYIQSWNLMVERKLISDIKVEVGYVATATRNQFADVEGNAAQGPNQPRPLAAIGRTASTLLWDGFATANYHSLQVAANRRYSQGLFIKAAYTYSKAINLVDDSGWAGLPLFNAGPQIGRNRALASYDIPHNFQLGGAYELPFGKGKKWLSEGVASRIIGGWSVSGVGGLVSGRPVNVTAAAGSLNAPGNTQTPDLIGPITYPKGIGPGRYWFDPTVFRPVDFSPEWLAAPANARPFRFGSLGRNVVRAPGFGNIDGSIIRNFKFTERVNMDFRVDIFNLTNTPHFVNAPPTGHRFNSLNASNPTRDANGNIRTNPDGTLQLNGFGQILSADQDQRQFRFGVRIGF